MKDQRKPKNNRSKEPKRAVCYLRVAKSLDADSSAVLDAQREACEQKARELGVTIVDFYTDAGRGSAIDSRPSMRAMLLRVDADRDIAYVIAWDYARLARNARVYRHVMQVLDAAGVELVTVKENGSAVHHALASLTAAMAELDTRHRREARRARKEAS